MNDPTMVRLTRVIQQGWPESGKDLPNNVKVYFPYRFELHIVSGVFFLQDRVVIHIGLRRQFLNKIHNAHLGVVKLKLLARTLMYWPNWNNDVEKLCIECETCWENQEMPANMPEFQVNSTHPGEIYGIDIAEIQSRQHLVCVDYKSCCIFERELNGLHTTEVVKALKSIFCDVSAPNKIISDNARCFVSEEFQEFTMQWSIHHITSSPRFPHGNAHTEKAVHIVKQINQKANDVKLVLLLLKTTPISSRNKSGNIHNAPGNVFFGRQLKVHLPVFQCHQYQSLDYSATCTDKYVANSEVLSKYSKGQSVWIKLDPNTKWMPGKITQVLPHQSYTDNLSDGCEFRRNEHHITIQ